MNRAGRGDAGDCREHTPGGEKGTSPWFSIIIPVWDRADVIRRCLDSVFSQDFEDYEIIVVDDGSEDDSVAVMRTYADPRLKIIVQPENQGVCATRHTGTEAAAGKWFLYLDSDWVLLPGVLQHLQELTARAPAEVGVTGTCCRTNEGEVWPNNLPPEGVFGFPKFLRWMNIGMAGHPDFLYCHRREVHKPNNQWPTDRRLEAGIMMRVASKWKYLVSREVYAIVYTDCINRFCSSRTKEVLQKHLASAEFIAKDREEILSQFSDDLKCYSPQLYRRNMQAAAFHFFLIGHRSRGLAYLVRILVHRPWSIQLWGILVLGLIGPRALMWPLYNSTFRSLYRFVRKLLSSRTKKPEGA